ncbi:GLUG motif-containing protein [Methylocapsa acidiphila]|uniref:GLUG motif-containing protein n=1 Tax=Methylocapsa acidiphila TaxID=133552 RepID=UPI000415C337|nr:GLUG motif-containing protein [Methylocapsa acidiphila]
MVNVNITSGAAATEDSANGYNGGLIAASYGSVINAFATGSITGVGAIVIGGLIGESIDSSISNSYADVTINSPGGSFVGGLLGYDKGGAVIDATDAADSYANYVGRFVGANYGGNISRSYATGDVTACGNVGVLIGYNISDSVLNGNIDHSYATWTVRGNVASSTNLGGLIGENDGGDVSYSYATGDATGGNTIGGLLGSNGQTHSQRPSGYVTDSYTTGNVTATNGNYGGGLVAGAGGVFIRDYAKGNVTASGDYAGGLVGDGGEIINSQAYGTMSGRDYVGGAQGFGSFLDGASASGNVTGRNYVGGLLGKSLGDSYGPVVILNSECDGARRLRRRPGRRECRI